jgi:hypothetical protein
MQCSLRALESMADLILEGENIPDDISLQMMQVVPTRQIDTGITARCHAKSRCH